MKPLASLGDYPFYQHRALGQAQCLANFPKAWPDQRCVSNILPTLNEQEATKSRRSLEHSPHCVACVGKMFIKCSYLFGAPPCNSRLTNKPTALRGAIRLYTLLITGNSAPPTLFLASGNRPPSPDHQGKSNSHCDTHFASNGFSTDHPVFEQGTTTHRIRAGSWSFCHCLEAYIKLPARHARFCTRGNAALGRSDLRVCSRSPSTPRHDYGGWRG